MFIKLCRIVIACTFAFLLSGRGLCQTPSDVPKDHWAYSAVEDLASKGLIKGYPPEGDFFGKRTVTRYEMATILQRVLARIDELLAAKANKEEVKPATPGVSQEQLEEV